MFGVLAKAFDLPSLELLSDTDSFYNVHLDQCMCGLRGPAKMLIRKSTRIATTNMAIANSLKLCCSGDHDHERAEGGATKGSENYPWPMAARIADGITGLTMPPPTDDADKDTFQTILYAIEFRMRLPADRRATSGPRRLSSLDVAHAGSGFCASLI